MKRVLSQLYWFLVIQLGINSKKTFTAIFGIPRYFREYSKFRKNYKGRLEFLPCLHDWYEEAGVTKSEYFLQDLSVAKRIFASNPHRHLDIGSRIDGFVANVASFRNIEVYDIRPMSTIIPGIIFKQADLMTKDNFLESNNIVPADSVSCLHTLEHFGLGRYGDSIDVDGYRLGLNNLCKMVAEGGTFYLSTPIGQERVEFNANRVFSPKEIISLVEMNIFRLKSLTVIRQDGSVEEFLQADLPIEYLAGQRYNLGLFEFVRLNEELI
jgi:hypothetical protein